MVCGTPCEHPLYHLGLQKSLRITKLNRKVGSLGRHEVGFAVAESQGELAAASLIGQRDRWDTDE